jgi:hypothetical protein
MKPKTLAKMFVDLLMFVIYLQLTFCYGSNTLFHEIAGIAIGVLFIVHVVLNAKTVAGMTRKLGRGRLSVSSKIQLVCDYLLPIVMIVTIVTGLLIAEDLYFGPGGYEVVVAHNIAAYVGLGILALHLVTHVRYLVGVTRKLVRTNTFRAINSVAGACLVIGVLIWTNLFGVGSGATTLASSASTATAATTTTTTTTTTSDHKGHGSSVSSSDSSGSSSNSSSSVSSSTTSSSSSSSSSGSVVCTQCGRGCPVTNLRCSRGTTWAESAGYL